MVDGTAYTKPFSEIEECLCFFNHFFNHEKHEFFNHEKNENTRIKKLSDTNSLLKLYNNVSYFLCVLCGFFSLCPLWETES